MLQCARVQMNAQCPWCSKQSFSTLAPFMPATDACVGPSNTARPACKHSTARHTIVCDGRGIATPRALHTPEAWRPRPRRASQPAACQTHPAPPGCAARLRGGAIQHVGNRSGPEYATVAALRGNSQPTPRATFTPHSQPRPLPAYLASTSTLPRPQSGCNKREARRDYV
jgi:hypothetical protein